MEIVATVKQNKIHPHKFTLWVGIGSIIMMFAGLTSAYIVKRNQPNWTTFDIPVAFWYSTAAIVISSLTMVAALRSFKSRLMMRYRLLMAVTLVLGIVFVTLQVYGFKYLWSIGQTFQGNVAYSFLYTIVGLHAVHVIGGLIALIIMSIQAFSRKQKNYNAVPLEVMATYWHFVDVLWIYLLVFLVMIR